MSKDDTSWTNPPLGIAAIEREQIALARLASKIREFHDEQGLTQQDKAPWNGLAEKHAIMLTTLLGGFLARCMPADVDWSVAALVFTNRPGDPVQAVDMISASTKTWDAQAAIQEWLDGQDG